MLQALILPASNIAERLEKRITKTYKPQVEAKMRRRALLLVFVLLLLGSPVAVMGKKKRRGKKIKNKRAAKKIEVSISSGDMCVGCMSFVEDYHKELARKIDWAHKHANSPEEATLDGAQIAREICNGDRFSHYKENIRWACTKLVNENWAEVVKPMAGKVSPSTVHERRAVLEKKRTMCLHEKVKACKEKDFKLSRAEIKKSPCEACKAVVEDIEFVLHREKQTTSNKRLTEATDSLCSDIGMRHEATSYLEEVCDDILDDVQADVVTQIRLMEGLKRSGFNPSDSLSTKVCTEITSYCPKDPPSRGAGGRAAEL